MKNLKFKKTPGVADGAALMLGGHQALAGAESRNHQGGANIAASYQYNDPYQSKSTFQKQGGGMALQAYKSNPVTSGQKPNSGSQPVKAQHNAVSSLFRSFSGAKNRGGSSQKGGSTDQQQSSEIEKLREENRGLRAKIDEVWEEKTQLKNNLKIQKEMI